MCSHINVRSSLEITIKDLAEIVKKVTDYNGKIYFDANKTDGSPRKLLDCSLIKSYHWKPQTNLKNGLIKTCKNFFKL